MHSRSAVMIYQSGHLLASTDAANQALYARPWSKSNLTHPSIENFKDRVHELNNTFTRLLSFRTSIRNIVQLEA